MPLYIYLYFEKKITVGLTYTLIFAQILHHWVFKMKVVEVYRLLFEMKVCIVT